MTAALSDTRVLGHVFNPISVHWCYDRSGELACIVAEVHNTYGDRHAYLLRPDDAGRVEQDKEFYVSPFLAVDGRYVMRFSPPGQQLSVTMALQQGNLTPFTATLRGSREPATRRALVRAALRHPLITFSISGRIRYQGVKLWLRRLPVVPRPKQKGVQ